MPEAALGNRHPYSTPAPMVALHHSPAAGETAYLRSTHVSYQL